MRLYLIHWLFTAACVTGCWDAAIAQVAPATILKIDTDNFTIYLNDETDLAKLALNPDLTRPKRPANFATLMIIADIVAVNGRPVRGTHLCRGLNVAMSTNPTPGQAIGDVVGRSTPPFFLYLDCVETILWPDGTLIGSITFRGLENTDPSPGAPLEQPRGSLVVTGGSGAFLGVRGQSGALAGRSRSASITEDPSKRRIFGAGGDTLILHIVPMSRPEIEMTASGNAVAHSSDSNPVTQSQPARPGEILTLFASGLGPTRPGVDPESPFTADPVQIVNSPVELTVNGKPAEVLYAGGYPGAVDRYQVNFKVPEGTAAGLATIQLTAAWVTGPGVRIAVQ
jgi:hypothetical protein